MLRPAPRRFASATSAERSATAVMAPSASTNMDFMSSPGDALTEFLIHVSGMQCNDAGRLAVVINAIEAGVRHHRLQCLLIGMHPNRFGPITITPFVVRDSFAEAGQHVVAVPIIRRPEELLH